MVKEALKDGDETLFIGEAMDSIDDYLVYAYDKANNFIPDVTIAIDLENPCNANSEVSRVSLNRY